MMNLTRNHAQNTITKPGLAKSTEVVKMLNKRYRLLLTGNKVKINNDIYENYYDAFITEVALYEKQEKLYITDSWQETERNKKRRFKKNMGGPFLSVEKEEHTNLSKANYYGLY